MGHCTKWQMTVIDIDTKVDRIRPVTLIQWNKQSCTICGINLRFYSTSASSNTGVSNVMKLLRSNYRLHAVHSKQGYQLSRYLPIQITKVYTFCLEMDIVGNTACPNNKVLNQHLDTCLELTYVIVFLT